VEFGFDMFVKSNSNAFFPAAGGDEAAIRVGANATIANGFAAGGYPGQGNRNLLTDGHFADVELTTTP
jgi:NAD(P)H-dependent flavin oxidoreductase YrpB (nitropropane dioxygenase family)